MLFSKIMRWLNGDFVCLKCKKELNAMWFGYGAALCPDCYNGEEKYVWFDDSFVLNRFCNWLLLKIDRHVAFDNNQNNLT